MSTYCRITGKSRGLPKPNYFPLLPPISPADAKRFCRITGKSIGQPTHHYLPVLICRKKKDKANSNSDKFHKIINGFRYLTPNTKSVQPLINSLEINTDDNNNYVYTVTEKQCGLVFSATLEEAVRIGKIKDVMLAKDEDQLLLKLNKGDNITIDIEEINNFENLKLLEGHGIAKIVKRKNTAATSSLCKIFEDKENAEIVENKIKKPLIKGKKNKKRKWKDVIEIKFKEEFIKDVNIESWTWNNFDTDKNNNTNSNNCEQLITRPPSPINLKPIIVNLKDTKPGLIQQPQIFQNCTSLETAIIVAPFQPLLIEPDESIIESIKNLNENQLNKTTKINDEYKQCLPKFNELLDVVHLIKCKNNFDTPDEFINGIKIVINGIEKFILGQLIETEDGKQFIPGQTILTSGGQQKFVPGITLINDNNDTELLPGCLIEIDGQSEFIAGQWTMTSFGEKFVKGQILDMEDENGINNKKFIPGQTVIVNDELKFIPGQIFEDRLFIPGQTLTIDEQLSFIPGQTVENGGKNVFIPGQSLWCEKGWEFIPGITEKGAGKFVPGKFVISKDDPMGKFMPGQYAKINCNEEIFVPGITIGENDMKFVCGQTIDTPNGKQFIQGQIIKNKNGQMQFLPGNTIIENGEMKFEMAKSLEELKYEKEVPNESFTKKELYPDGVFGQMVQTLQGVEFFPGEANCLPKGKVVAGKLIRGNEVKFIPGLIIDGQFVPGQIVITDDGEQFIPGQVIETSEGAKFVPGQIIITKDGEKFVPGQTITTENGAKFIPGQIIETKAGSAFIPGQVINTNDGNSKFVPGEVLETIDGPRFVPGRVVEAGDYVTFIPGQVVQTVDGLKFIAPDLIGEEDEDQEFTLQGFDISPEELHLLQPKGTNLSSGDLVIDSNMLKQLSEAGMRIGSQITTEIPEVSVRSAPAMSTACALAQKLKLDPVSTVKVSQIIASVVQIGKFGEICGNGEVVDTLNGILERVVHCKNDEEAYKLISNIIEKEFSKNILENIDKLHAYVTSNESPLKRLNKINIMKEILNCGMDRIEILDKLVLIMKDEDETISKALQRIHQVQPEIVNIIIERFMESVGQLENEKDITETLHKSIVSSIREASEMCIVDLLKDKESVALKALILDAVALAKALDMNDIAITLTNILSNPKCANIFAGDRIILEILRKLTVMKKLAEKKPEFLTALKNLNLDPYKARTDPNLVQLSKESQALLVIPEEENVIKTCENLPTSLLFSQNSLAMEEYLSRTKRLYKILVIIKNGIQAIIPREASHSVLAGTVPYAVLNEKGLHYFQPKHVFNALKLPKIATHWFSLYKCEYKDITSNDIPIVTS